MQMVLLNTAVMAGDYDACISGVYGDTSSTESSREIIPLLKQLINMLEKGVNFTLSAELLQEMAGYGGPGGDPTHHVKVEKRRSQLKSAFLLVYCKLNLFTRTAWMQIFMKFRKF